MLIILSVKRKGGWGPGGGSKDIVHPVFIGACYLFTASTSVVKNVKVDVLMLSHIFWVNLFKQAYIISI